MKKITLIFGTRPEAIKMIPVYKELKNRPEFDVRICLTGQHREMVAHVMNFFDVKEDYDLAVMRPNQTLHELTSRLLLAISDHLDVHRPDVVLVHGDTATTLTASLASFYKQIPVGHVEAGLRTYDLKAPFPEEMNRQFTSIVSTYNFCPTQQSLEQVNAVKNAGQISEITGNTVIDALFLGLERLKQSTLELRVKPVVEAVSAKKIILVTGHRRENFGDGFKAICRALVEIANRSDVHIIYPVHLNPNVKGPVHDILGNHESISLIEPLEYHEFIYLMSQSHIILTDSGGIQEEAPSLGKPVLVMRDKTERPEAVDVGTVKLVGTDQTKITQSVIELLDNHDVYQTMSEAHNPYGDGQAAARIANILSAALEGA